MNQTLKTTAICAGLFGCCVVSEALRAGNYDDLEMRNRYNRPIDIEIRDGGATATGSSCETNRSVTTRTLQPTESVTLPCGGRDGYCWRWKDSSESSFGAWYGTTCGGHVLNAPTRKKMNF